MSMHSFDPAIAARVGLNAAVIYQNIFWWCEKNRANRNNEHDGHYWTYNSVKAWAMLFPYLTQKQIRTALDKLEAEGLILSGCYNASAYDRTKWYCPASQTDLPHRANESACVGEPIPVSKPDIKPDINLYDANASSALSAQSDVEIAVEDYNAMAERAGLPKAQKITPARKSALSKRIKDAGGLDGWRVALEKVEASPFCTGQNDKGWKADLDFILQERSFTRIMEGTYDAKKPTGTSQQSRNGGNSPAHESLFAGFASVARRHGG